MKTEGSIPAEVMGEFNALLISTLSLEEKRFLHDRRPFSINEEDMEWAERKMEQDAKKEHDLHLYNLECAASKWKRKVEFGKWVAHKPENRAYFTRKKHDDIVTYRAFAALKGGVK